MSGYFDAVIDLMLAKRIVRMAYLVQFDFKTTPKYLWNGSRRLTTGGHDWVGLRGLGGIDGIDEALDGTSSQVTVTVSAALSSGIMATAAAEDKTEYAGNLLRIWMQFFDENWQPVGSPYARFTAIMDSLSLSRAQDGKGGWVRTVTVNAENIFFNRRMAPNGYFTDHDQQARFSGDTGLKFIPQLQHTEYPVPW